MISHSKAGSYNTTHYYNMQPFLSFAKINNRLLQYCFCLVPVLTTQVEYGEYGTKLKYN